MRILVVHNHYGDYVIGGEALVMQAEVALLRSHGHDVRVYERTNAEIARRGLRGQIQAFRDVPWSEEGYQAVAREIDKFKPEVMHVHNYRFLLSPSIFKAAKERGVATCLTLHNYRLACPAGQFLRDGRVCEDCIQGMPYRMFWRRCSSKDTIKTLAQFYLYWDSRRRHYLAPCVDAYIALTEFGRTRFVAAGLPAGRVHVKPHFMEDPTGDQSPPQERRGALFVGRLSPEKGVDLLLEAWRGIDYPLFIVGDGPLRAKLEKCASANVIFLGPLEHTACLTAMKKSAFLVFPSVWYEGFGLSLMESMACGIPSVAFDLGPRREMVIDGHNGFLCPAEDVGAFRERICALIGDQELRETMGANARAFYLAHYTAKANYPQLVNIYKAALMQSQI